jgi:hypothetical protein
MYVPLKFQTFLLQTTQHYNPEDCTLYSHRLGKQQSWSGCCEVEKNLLPLPGIEPLAVQSAAHHYMD